MGKYKCKVCGSLNTITTKHPIREQRQVYCEDCKSNCKVVEYMKQNVLGEFI